jgi:uncharacterized protein (DUF2235 family)
MGKAIIFCADGTWNGPEEPGDGDVGRTNVYKTFSNLDGSPAADPTLDEQERTVVDPGGKLIQIAKYLHGVGNTGNPLVRFLGGTVGAGLVTRIVRGYTFISRNYLAGDRIYILGFSRGAYTARALAGLISAKGLLDATSVDLKDDKAHAYNLALSVWYDYRRQAGRGGGILGDLRGALDGLAALYLDRATSTLLPHVPIEAVAVWDTVGSLGIPLYDHGAVLDVFQFADLNLPPAVRTGLHAVATDEQRETFTPTFWNPDPRVTQVLFPGAHADIGGGNNTPADGQNHDGLSDIALTWIANRLALLGAVFDATPTYTPAPDARAIRHRPWLAEPWPALGVNPRTLPADIRVKQDLINRLRAGTVPLEGAPDSETYAPANAQRFAPANPIQPHDIEP